MGAIKDFGKKTVDTAKKAGEWCSDHAWEALEYAGAFFAGYGLTAFMFDITGVTDAVRKGIRSEGFVAGYDSGYREGQTDAATIIGIANNGGVPPVTPEK